MNASIYMTDIPRQRPTLVLMAGFGGSGKTTLAHALAARLKWPVLDKDVLKAQIIRTCDDISEEVASRLAYELLFAQAQDFLMLQSLSVILDTSAVYPAVTTSARRLMQMADAHLKIILCKANTHTRRLRLQQRNERDAGRRQLLINLSVLGEDNWQCFDHLPLEHLIELDTIQPFEEYLQKALHYLNEDCTIL